MKDSWTKAALGAAALVCVGAANAGVIDFENIDTTGAPFAPAFITDQDFVTQGNYFISAYDAGNINPAGLSGAPAPDGALVGALLNGSAPLACLDGRCPTGNTTNYLGSVNDGVVYIDKGGAKLSLIGFDAAFLAPADLALPSTTVAFLGVEADRSDGSFALSIFPLLGPAAGGTTSFASFLASHGSFAGGTGTLTSGNVVDLQFIAYFCDQATGNCSFGTTDRGQFALDNIAFSVPEPSSWLLMALGLGAIGTVARRRRPL